MLPGPDAQRIRGQVLVFWIIWGAILAALGAIHLLFGRAPVRPASSPNLAVVLVALVPLFGSIVIRSLVLPRVAQAGPALGLFIAGVATSEACGLIGIFLGGPYRDHLFLLGLLGVVSYVPIFVKRQLEPKPRGFIPNN